MIYDEVEVRVRHTQLACDSLLQGLNAFGIPQPFDSTNSRQTALVGSKVLCYLLDTIYVPLQLDLCCINKKSVKDNKKSAENLNAFAATGHTVVCASRCRFCAFETMHFEYRPELL